MSQKFYVPENRKIALGISEDIWFKRYQKVLLWMANTDYGRDLLCISKHYGRIIQFSKKHVTSVEDIEDGQIIKHSDFRIGAKWGNVIRYRFDEVLKYWAYYEKDWKRLLRAFVEIPVIFAPGLVTDNFFPDPTPTTTTVDGIVFRSLAVGSGEVWGTLRTGAGTGADDTTDPTVAFQFTADTGASNWRVMTRSMFLFDTSSIPDGDTITAATMSLFGTAKADGGTNTPNINVYTTTPASNTALASGDQNSFGTVAQATAIAFADWSTTAYNVFTLNSTGLGNISKTGVTKFGCRNQAYDADNSAPTWSSGANHSVSNNYAEAAGTANDPKLAVTHSLAVTPTFMLLGIGAV